MLNEPEMLPKEILCPDCGAELTLSERDRIEKKFTCSVCKEMFIVKEDPAVEMIEHDNIAENSSDEEFMEGDAIVGSSKLVTVYIPSDEAERLVIGSLLQGAGISYSLKSVGVQNLFGAGQIGGSFNLAAGAIEIQVANEDVDKAREIIKGEYDASGHDIPEECPGCNSLTKGSPQCPECGLVFVPSSKPEQREARNSGKEYSDTHETVSSMVRKSMLFSIFWFLGIGSIFAIYYGWRSLKLIHESKEEIPGKGKATFGIIFGIIGVIVCAPIWYGFIVNF